MENVMREALSLWELWFKNFGLCWTKNPEGIEFCVFCRAIKPNHALQCPYPYAKELIKGLSYKDSPFYDIDLCPLGHTFDHYCTTCRDITMALEKAHNGK